MRERCRVLLGLGLGVALVCGLSACAARAPMQPKTQAQAYEETPVPTVPASTPTPLPEAPPIPTHPIGHKIKATKGHPVGPIVTFFGAGRADGSIVQPESVDKKGIPTYRSSVGSGFMLIVEVKPGAGGFEPGRAIFSYSADDPTQRPDLEIEANRDLGDGSPAVCDRLKPNIGGIPGINPPNFAETQRISDAINDFGCRFETFLESDGSCTMSKSGDYSFVSKETTTQFCMLVAKAYAFPVGETLLTVRVRDSEGNPGPSKQMRIRRPSEPARASKKK